MSSTTSWRVVVPGVALTLTLALAARLGSREITSVLMDGKASPVSPVLLGIVFGILWRHFIGLRRSAGKACSGHSARSCASASPWWDCG